MHKELNITTILISVLLFAVLCLRIAPPVESVYTGETKPMEFYFHYVDAPVTVAGLQTKHTMDTTREFRFSTQQEAFTHSFYKPLGLPKIVIVFYLYPNLAGPITVDGSWQVFVWLNGSAYKPTTFSLAFKEITTGGVVLWDSGQLNPTVTSSIGAYMDVPVYNYNLSVPLTHTFSAASTVSVEFEVNTGSSADTRFWYDSQLYPSKVILPVADYARPISIKTHSIDNSETSLFHYNWTERWRKVIVRTNLTDPFGGYDISTVHITILDPAGYPVLEEAEMPRVSDGQWQVNYSHLFEANWSYPSTAMLGNYTVIISVVDNNGYYRNLDFGSVEPHTENETHVFTIGVVVYYDPTFAVIDDVDAPLPDAQVYVTWRNGSTETLPRYTSIDGLFNLTQVSAGDYGFTVLWKDAVVAQTTVHVDSDGPYFITAQVYQLTLQVFGNNGVPVHGAYVIVNTRSGVGIGLDTTNQTGHAQFKLPPGTYAISVHYTVDYWLTVVRASVSEQVPVASSISKNLVLQEFPPPIWSTTLFSLLLAAAIVTAMAILMVLYVRRGG